MTSDDRPLSHLHDTETPPAAEMPASQDECDRSGEQPAGCSESVAETAQASPDGRQVEDSLLLSNQTVVVGPPACQAPLLAGGSKAPAKEETAPTRHVERLSPRRAAEAPSMTPSGADPLVVASLARPALPSQFPAQRPNPQPRAWRRPLMLFVLTCLSTFWAGASGNDLLAALTDPGEVFLSAIGNARQGLLYMGAVMGILLAHEMGHFLQAVRYRVPASFPIFIPMPITPLGTMGAVIALRGSQANRKELFDIGLTGPWAGLAVALPMAVIGIRSAEVLPLGGDGLGGYFGDPLVFKLLAAWLRPEVASGSELVGHANPLVMASWVGMLVTGLNMLPIGQLDGGHATYALLGANSRWLARAMVAAALAFIVYAEQYGWSVMLALVVFLGTSHPPTANDAAPLGRLRSTIGWISLLIPIFCLTPFPFVPS
jgi:Zn-dependent protease